MLKHFHVFECRVHDEIPMCRALLCIGKVASKTVAYAWVDTITNDGELNITPVLHDTPIQKVKVKETINALCGTSHESESDLFNALHQYMLVKAEEKLLSRERWYRGQNRKYRTSHFAATDAALAQIPHFPLSDLPGQLKAERDQVPYRKPDYNTLFQGVSGPKPKWTWEDNYREPDNMLHLLQEHAAEVPYPEIPNKTYAARRIQKGLKEVRTKTPKARLLHLMEMVQSMPVMNYKSYSTRRTKNPWHIMVPKWFQDNPPPLNQYDATRLAKLPFNEMMEVIAQQRTWLHYWYAMQAEIRKDTLGDEVKRFEWNVDAQSLNEYPVEYDAEEEWFLCRPR